MRAVTADAGRRSFAWMQDLVLGVRLSVAGGRSGWLRLALIAAGVGLGVGMLLVLAAAPTATAAREQRRADRAIGATVPQARPDTLLALTVETRFRDEVIRGRILRPDGDRAPAPPGVTRVPAAGEIVVSPALAALLDGPDGRVLAGRWSARVAGIIAPAGLSGPDEMWYYLGSGTLSSDDGAQRIASFGGGTPSGTDAMTVVLAVVGAVILLLPVLVFVTTAVRFGSASRDRQLAAIRLVGADSRMTRRIACGDTLIGAVIGLATGGLLFLGLRHVVGGLLPADFTPYPSDLRPVPALLALILILVPVGAVLVTLSALRRVVIEPLGVVRQSGARRRRLWWRLVPPVTGAALLYPLVGGLPGEVGGGTRAQLAAGAILLLTSVVVLLPWLVQAVVRHLGGGSVAWQLGVRRLQLDSDTAVRSVSGIAVSVAGIIAVQGLLGASIAATSGVQPPADRFQIAAYTNGADGTGWRDALTNTPGVTAVRTSGYVSLRTGTDDQTSANVRVGDCDVLRQYAPLPACADGDAFRTVQPGWDGAALAAGTTARVYGTDDTTPLARWRVPADLPAVTAYPSEAGPMEYLATPAALKARPDLRGVITDAYLLRLDPADPDAVEHVRTTMIRLAPAAPLQLFGDDRIGDQFGGARRLAQACGLLLLLFIGASMLVNVTEQLRERRRVLAVLVAFGTRRRTLAASLLHQVAVPAAVGLVLAVVIGGSLSAVLLAATRAPVTLDWPALTAMTGAVAAMIIAVTAAGLPLLLRLSRVQELRSE
ncbi:putative permease [Actinoplanes missouriensis 431]|uniref:Putative permease n=1 Tax=Actinoplanes missouriensis (strain ATCC 14538 / DSM 43046 / CBS 188.64 / JCM 3121 / NBRC 102363 / NCIMB 12654 / NRRL B-3342 / UNCC 431) TaxID=512565 RepID=I0H4H1_ACTM4|nr:FtsX-like permease family protein [Actinoplanes missouriensis]BAL87908.1 putative permease [Actinoplanes missouriensis 431]